MNTTGITELVDEARQALALRKVDDDTIDIPTGCTEADMLIGLYAEQEEQKRIADQAARNRKKITDALVQLCPEGALITIDGEPLFERRVDIGRAIDSKAIAAAFPDTDTNAELWKDTRVVKSIWAPVQPGGAS